jgi:hypothetical protein
MGVRIPSLSHDLLTLLTSITFSGKSNLERCRSKSFKIRIFLPNLTASWSQIIFRSQTSNTTF